MKKLVKYNTFSSYSTNTVKTYSSLTVFSSLMVKIQTTKFQQKSHNFKHVI